MEHTERLDEETAGLRLRGGGSPGGRGKGKGFDGGGKGGRGGGKGGRGYGGTQSKYGPPLPTQAPMEDEPPPDMDAYDDIPVEASGEDCPMPIEQFSDVQLHPALAKNIEAAKFVKPTPVQRHSIPVGIARRDLMACAQTGSGKTGAFLFPTLHQMLLAMDQVPDPGVMHGRAEPRALILAPTRELATQIFREGQKFAFRTHVHPVVVYGGADIRGQCVQLERGCQLLVATPGRLCDLIERGKVSTLSGSHPLHRSHHCTFALF